MKKGITLLFILVAICLLQAARLSNVPTTVYQPDGTELQLFASGDEFFNRLHDKDNYTVIQSSDGYYYYAESHNGKLQPSAIKAGIANLSKADLKPGLVISETEYQQKRKDFYGDSGYQPGRAPHEGTLNNIVVYIRFADQPEFVQPRTFFDEILNNSSENANSVLNYYKEVSYNMLNLVSVHFPVCDNTTNISFQDTHPRNYYNPYNANSNLIGYNENSNEGTIRKGKLLKEAILAVESQIPANLMIDSDKDGKVDNVSFVIRGQANAAGLLWPHRSFLSSETVTIHGKRVWDYIFMLSDEPDYLNRYVFCHELFHALGAPDLYHKPYMTTNTMLPVGDWDLMESGSGHMGAWMKHRYTNGSWLPLTDALVTQSGRYTLSPLSESKNSWLIINSPNSAASNQEFFVIEYRKKGGAFESAIPNSGLLAYRINTSFSGNDDANDEVYIYRPDGTSTTSGNLGYAAMAQNYNRTAINNGTNPASLLTNGTLGDLDVYNVSEIGSTISFNIDIHLTGSLFSAQGSSLSQNAIRLTWQKRNSQHQTLIIANTENSFGRLIDGTVYQNGQNIPGGGTVVYSGSLESFDHLNLQPEKKYYYRCYAFNDLKYSSASELTKETVSNTINSLPYITDFETLTGLPAGWLQENQNPSWKIGNGNGSSSTAAHSGIRNLYLIDQSATANINKLILPPINLSNGKSGDFVLNFWLSLKARNALQDELKIFYKPEFNQEWQLLKAFNTSIVNWTEQTIDLPAPSANYQLALEGNARYGYGILIDDLKIATKSGISNLDKTSNLALFNYPNPFNNTTAINFSIPLESKVELKIFNAKGEIVHNFSPGILKSGWHRVDFNASALNSGIYFCTLKSQNREVRQKLLFLK